MDGASILIGRIARADDAALDELLRGFGAPMRALARRLAGPGLADDALQESLIALRRDARGFAPRGDDPDAAARCWILRVVAHAALDLARGERRRRRREADAAADAAHSAMPAAGPHDAVADADLAARVRAEIDGLPATTRDALLLHCVAGLTFAEIAQPLGTTPGALRKRVHLALRTLRRRCRPLAAIGVAAALDGAQATVPPQAPLRARLPDVVSPGAVMTVFAGVLALIAVAVLWRAQAPPPAAAEPPPPAAEGVAAEADLTLTIDGRETLPGVFEPGEPLTIRVREREGFDLRVRPWIGVGDAVVEIVRDGEAPRRVDLAATVFERLRHNYHETELRPSPDAERVPLRDTWRSWPRVSVAAGVITSGDELPADLVAAPGRYAVRVTVAGLDAAGRPVVATAAISIDVLSPERLAELERPLAIPRAQALAIGERELARLLETRPGHTSGWSMPLRLRLTGPAPRWHGRLFIDSGLVAAWWDLSIDATSGAATLAPTGGGA